jgi:hypothetical protein
MGKSIKVLTPKFRVSFPNVFKPKAAFEGQEPTYNIQMLFPKDTDLTEMKKAVKEAIQAKWGDKKPANLRIPFNDGDEKDYESHKGHYYVNSKSKMRPGIVDQELNDIIDPSDFYGGCYARATLTAFAYDTAGNKGVAFGLQNLQKLDDGEAFSGRVDAKNDFESVGSSNESSETDDDFDF